METLLLVLFCCYVLYVVVKIFGYRRYKKRLTTIPIRIHVNGIRGKSTVTRLVSSTLRAGGLRTLGKTTGTAARFITDDHTERPIARIKPNVNEQIDVIKHMSGFEAIVFECMAINPLYQRFIADKVIQPTISIVTNVREDHLGAMADDLEGICRVFGDSVPYHGDFITTETNPQFLANFEQVCAERGTRFHVVSGDQICDADMTGFRHFEYKDNVAIALKVAELLDIDQAAALEHMKQCLPDPGAFSLQKFEVPLSGERVSCTWANLFAINDKQSFVYTAKELLPRVPKDATKVLILNNRADRPERVELFFDTNTHDLQWDYIVTFGAFEGKIRRSAKYAGVEDEMIYLGDSTDYKHASGQELLDAIHRQTHSTNLFIVGTVNIHTGQAQQLLGYLNELQKEPALVA